jgi:hypothetical protein
MDPMECMMTGRSFNPISISRRGEGRQIMPTI